MTRGRADLLAVASYVLAAVVLCGRLLAHPGQRLPYTPGDRIQAEWHLALAARLLGRGGNPLLIDRMNAPVGVNGMANTTQYGLGVPMAPITWLLGPGVAFDVLIVLALSGTAAAWFWLLSRHVVDSRPAAWAGGLVGGFAPSVVGHATFHPNLAAQFLVPVIAWRVVRMLDSRRYLRDGLVLAALVVWQVFINEETLFITALALGVFLLLWRGVRWRPLLPGLGVAALAATAVLAYPLWYQFFGTGAYRGGERQMTAFHTDLLGVTSFSRTSVAVRWSEYPPAPGFSAEQHAHLGWPIMLAALAFVLWQRRDRLTRSLAITGAVFLALSLGTGLTLGGRSLGIPGPYAPLARLPLFDTLLPTRLGEVLTWCLAPLAALAAARCRLPSRLLTIGLAAALLVPAAPTPTPVEPRPAVPSFVSGGAWRGYVDADHSVLVVPLADFEHWTALSWSTATGLDMRLSHGYFLGPEGGVTGRHAIVGPPSRPLDRLLRDPRPVTDADRAAARADLAHWRTAIVLAPPGPAYAAQRRLLDDLFGPGRLIGGVWLWDVRGVR
ncbi:hypothetical protein ABT369_01125 [Dactylosporangium sp. NPDC000244]|uniref:hypothetical protein n=1 Tax=Dactylosporangium sp. NPDC000244 TaxID=3154365 RepID=UPI003327AEE8